MMEDMHARSIAGLRHRWHALALSIALVSMLAIATVMVSYGVSSSPGGRATGVESMQAARPKPRELTCISFMGITYCVPKDPIIIL
jgi:hypothetical protein